MNSSAEIGTFSFSLFVSIATILMTYWQVKAYAKEAGERRAEAERGARDASQWPAFGAVSQQGKDPRDQPAEDIDDQPGGQPNSLRRLGGATADSIWTARMTQGLDIATNFPSAILTLVAYSSLYKPSASSALVYIAVTTAICGAAFALGRVAVAGKYVRFGFWRRRVSYASALVVIANIIGLVIALHNDGAPTPPVP